MSETSKSSSVWLWLSLSLVVALFVGFILFLDQSIVKTASLPETDSEEKTAKQEPVFDFYRVLPERKVVIPQDELLPQGDVSTGGTVEPQPDMLFILQAGSFSRIKDADRRKAELALLGQETAITTADVDGKKYYRIEIGPLTERQNVSTQKLLITHDIDFLVKQAAPR